MGRWIIIFDDVKHVLCCKLKVSICAIHVWKNV